MVIFFGVSFMSGNGGTAPLAFPKEHNVPLRLVIWRLVSNLQRASFQTHPQDFTTTYVSLPTPS